MGFKLNYICVPTIPSDAVGRVKNMQSLASKFKSHDAVKGRLTNSQIAMNFSRYFKQATKKSLLGGDKHIPTVEELKRMYRYVNKGIRDLEQGKIDSFQKNLWLTEEIVKRSPEMSTWYKNENRIQSNYQGQETRNNNSLHTMAAKLRQQSGEIGLIAGMGNMTRGKAEKEIQRIEREITEAHNREDWGARDSLIEELDTYYKKGEGQVFKQFYELVTNGKAYANSRNTHPPLIVAAAKVWRQEIKPSLDRNINEGIDSFYWGLKNLSGKLYNDKNFRNSLRKVEIIKKQVDKYMKDPSMKSDFPVRMLDIVPTLGKVHELYNSKNNPEAYVEADNTLSNLVENVINMDISVAGTLFKTSDGKSRESMNVLPMLDQYTRTVSRFSMVGKSTQNMLESVHRIMEKKGNDEARAEELESHIDFIKDSYTDATEIKEATFGDELVRTLTNLQATFKLGLPNLKSPAKNVTQAFQHFTWWGYKGMKRTREFKNDEKNNIRISTHLKDNGILFQNLGETWGGPQAERIYDPVSGLWTEKIDVSIGEQMQRNLEKTTQKSLWAMTKVENAWNRKGAAEHGYAEKWRIDEANPSFKWQFENSILSRARRNDIKELQDENGNSLHKFDKKKIDYKDWAVDIITTLSNQKTHELWTGEGRVSDYDYHFEMFSRKSAGDWADAAIKDIHFDYSRLAKPGIMKNTKGGVLAGQFRTWWINNMNYQRKIFLEGKDDIMSGLYNGDHAWRLYRMGLQDMLLLGVLSPLLNINIGALVDNRTWWDSATMGVNVAQATTQQLTDGEIDPDTRDAILAGTYNNGIIVNMLGVHADTTLKLGSLAGFEGMSQDDTLSYLFGYDAWADFTQDEKVKEFASTLHTGIGRMVTEHIPNFLGGAGIGYAAEKEFGIKATPTQRGIKQAAMQYMGIEPEEIKETLTKPSRKIKTTSPYPLTQSEILQRMLADISMGGKKGPRPSPVSMVKQLERLQT